MRVTLPNRTIIVALSITLSMVLGATYTLVVLTDSTDEYMARMHVVSASRMMSAVDPAVQGALRAMGFGKAGYSQAGDAALLGGQCFGQLKPFISGGNVIPGTKGTPGINPTLACRLVKLLSDYPSVRIRSGYRSYATQKNMCGSGRKGCATPGKSCHQYGLAVDITDKELLYNVIPKRSNNRYQLHLAYSIKGKLAGHIQCIENPVASCSPRTLPCGGKSPDPSRMGQGPATVAPRGQPQGGSPQSGGASPGGGSPPPPSRPAANEHPFSHNGDGTDPYDPYGIWAATSTDAVAEITCSPAQIASVGQAEVAWRCGGTSTRSRGGSTNLESKLSTDSALTGQVSVSPSTDTGYKVQCLAGDKLLDEAICAVTIAKDGGIPTGPLTPQGVVLQLSASRSIIEWGESTQLLWATRGASECVIRGGGLRNIFGLEGAVDTGRLYRPTTYLLECDTSKGSKTKKLEIRIK